MRLNILALTLAFAVIACSPKPRAPRRPATPAATPAPPRSSTTSTLLVTTAAPDLRPAPHAAKSVATDEKIEAHAEPAEETSCVAVDEPDAAGLYRSDAPTPGEVVLTFDDGPYQDKTPVVLDLLAQHRFEATFFVLGRHITAKTYALLQRMEAEGHLIASHSYDHDIQMAHNPTGVELIVGQHEATRILIELALLANSADDFDAMHERVFGVLSNQRIAAHRLAREWADWRASHREILVERGHAEGRYAVRFSRPPGGGPYLGTSATPRNRYNRALGTLTMLNVMWHHQSGDVDATRARDAAFLSNNIKRGAERGGVLLLHDFIRPDALAAGLAHIAETPHLRVVGLNEIARHKYGCASAGLAGR